MFFDGDFSRLEIPLVSGIFQEQVPYEVMDGKIQDDRYRVIDDVIFYKDSVYLVPDSGLKKNILTVVHDSPLAGH
jgi:hypothetical protein